MSKPNHKFVCNMLYGLLASRSVLLGEISRQLNEPITLKKTIERLSNRLKAFTCEHRETLFKNYHDYTQFIISNNTIFCIDHSDIAKPSSNALENFGTIHDGSTNKNNIKSYNMFEIATLTTKKGMPLPVYSKVYSNYQSDYISITDETFKGLKYLTENFGWAWSIN